MKRFDVWISISLKCDPKSPYLFYLYFKSMYYKYLPCQILNHDFDEKSDFFNPEF